LLSQTSDYALRAVLVLAREYEKRALLAEEIAGATGAPPNYMSKTLNALAKAGVLKSARGPLGGFSLAVDPQVLTIARVIDCFETRKPQTRCILGTGPCDALKPCAAHHRWSAINRARREPLDVSIASLLEGQTKAAGLTLIA
jgi:Rrf2 family protein